MQTAAAIAACERAAQAAPTEPRYRYQLGRAAQSIDPKRAFAELSRAARADYPAAFDNIGSLHLDGRLGQVDPNQALVNFQRGAALEDPDAMVSLARTIFSSSPEQAVRWLERAAGLGHREAAEYLQRLRAAPYANQPSVYAPQPQHYGGDPGAQLMIQMLGHDSR